MILIFCFFDISFHLISSPAAESAPAAEQPFHFLQPPTVSQDARLCAGQPGPSALGEVGYNEPSDLNNDTDESAIINQLMEIPEFWDFISNPNINLAMPTGIAQGLEANFNQNFDPYSQDFSRFNDVQFNRLVNENQTLQSEPQDSSFSMVQVKTEEEQWGWIRIPLVWKMTHFGKYAHYLLSQHGLHLFPLCLLS